MTEITIKLQKGRRGYHFLDPNSGRQAFDLMCLNTHLDMLNAGFGTEISVKVIQKFARKYGLKVRIYPEGERREESDR